MLLNLCECAVDIIFNSDGVTSDLARVFCPFMAMVMGSSTPARDSAWAAGSPQIMLWVSGLLTAVFHERWKLLTGSPVSRKKTRRRLLRLTACRRASLSVGCPL